MSVQAGIWNFDGHPVDPKLIASFSESLKQQGPDGEFTYADGSIALLYRPFHTTAESRREKQPYISPRGFIVTWDGRLDNREELITELCGNLEAEPTDVTIVAAAFDRWETESFKRIIGDWAVCVWSQEKRELVFAVDYMAIRHIFYYPKQDQIWWSTDLSPLALLSGDKFHIDEKYIAGYFAHEPDGHLTPYREIREVPPGQFVRVRNGAASVARYWRPSTKSRLRYKTDTEYEDHFRSVFRQAVRRRLRSDAPVLAELSGGLDSSSIVCMADDILSKEEAVRGPCLETISYYDPTRQNTDDWYYLQIIETKRKKPGIHIDESKFGISPASLAIPTFCPFPGALGFGKVLGAQRSEAVRRGGYRVVLSGLGGDEFMGGVPDPRAHLADLIVRFRIVSLAKELIAWSLSKRVPWILLLWQSATEILPASAARYFVTEGKVEPWICKEFALRTGLATRQVDIDEHFGFWLPTRRSLVGGLLCMANRMAQRIPWWFEPEETRYPYLDQTLTEFILAIPASQLLRPGERRSLMRRSLNGIVSKEVLSRRSKQVEARIPIIALENNLEDLLDAFHKPLSSKMGFVDVNSFVRTLTLVRNGGDVHLARLLKTISLELWLRDLDSRRLLDTATHLAPETAPPLTANAGAT